LKEFYVEIKPKNHKTSGQTSLDQEHFLLLHVLPNCNMNKQKQPTKKKLTSHNIENKTCSTTFVTTNPMQTIELLKLHKTQEVTFDDSKHGSLETTQESKPNGMGCLIINNKIVPNLVS
jgi:hypothetical protein